MYCLDTASARFGLGNGSCVVIWKGRLSVSKCIKPECFLGVGGASRVAGRGVDEEAGGCWRRFRRCGVVRGDGEKCFCDADKGFLFFLVGAGAESELDILCMVASILLGQRGLRGVRSDGKLHGFCKVCTYLQWRRWWR